MINIVLSHLPHLSTLLRALQLIFASYSLFYPEKAENSFHEHCHNLIACDHVYLFVVMKRLRLHIAQNACILIPYIFAVVP